MAGSYPFYLDEFAYIRHRARHIRHSVYRDARHVLFTRRDFAGRLAGDPDVATDSNGDPIVYSWLDTKDSGFQLPLLGQNPMTFIDYFPEDGLAAYEHIEPNTLALDNGRAEDEYQFEMGGFLAQEWTFNFALNAATDAIAQAVFQDLNDRYVGRVAVPPRQELLDNLQSGDDEPEPFHSDLITLYNYATDPPIPTTRMEVESFRFAKNADEEVAPGVQLFFGELVLTDFFPQVA